MDEIQRCTWLDVDARSLMSSHGNLHEERECDCRHRRVDLAPTPGDELDRNIRNEADADARGDGIGEGNGERGCGGFFSQTA